MKGLSVTTKTTIISNRIFVALMRFKEIREMFTANLSNPNTHTYKHSINKP